MQTPPVLFITGIGTDVGKSYATGWLAREIARNGSSVITQKFIQTGNQDMSEDIAVHRRIMGIDLLPEDIDHITAPVIFSYPASPDLAARIDNKPLNLDVIDTASATLSRQYQTLLIEGAGGIMVPLNGQYLTIDYIAGRNLPTVVVTNGQLGSVSDTLLTLEAIKVRNIPLWAIIYNPYFDKDTTIAADSRVYMQQYMKRHFPDAHWLEMPDAL
ncbi:MAG: dethiobiotin synthase [Muribaculaceae bacterium]|nr:dethiobiotin synthase [Muribaculaceae bacterium]